MASTARNFSLFGSFSLFAVFVVGGTRYLDM